MYHGAGVSLAGKLDNGAAIGKLFCNDFDALRAKTGGKGFEAIKKNRVSFAKDGQCEYFQDANPNWGLRFDLIAKTHYGLLDQQEPGQKIYWQVDSMVGPLNYSSLKQYSSLLLLWESEGRVQGVLLTRSRINVSGALLGAMRTKLKSSMASLLEGYAVIIK